MKKIFTILIIHGLLITANAQTGSVGIGTTNPNSSAALDIQSTSKGVLIPRMTTVQRIAIASPATGLLVYDNTTNSFWFRNATSWVELSDTANNIWKKNGNNTYVNATGNVGIGVDTPQYHLDIRKPNASLAFTDEQTLSGVISGNSSDLNINASRAIIGQGFPGNLILQTSAFFAAGGNVGIGTTTPSFKLDVNGDTRLSNDLYVFRDLWVDRNLDVDGTSNFGGDISASSNVNVTGNITVDNGKGILRSTNSLQLVVAFPSGAVGFTNAPPGHSQDVEFVLPNVFSSVPLINVSQVLNATGTFEQWLITIHSIDIVTHRFIVRFYNSGSTNSTLSATYRFTAIGAAL